MSAALRPRPPLMRALGRRDAPPEVVVGGTRYTLVDQYKHDTWAATARYHSATGDIVCKFNRTQPVMGLPTAWIGRRLAERERRALRLLADIRGIPAESGPVYVDGKHWPNAVAHEFIAGRPLEQWEWVPDGFFPELQQMLRTMHARHMAYVDLHKRENILIGDDQRPYLIDFQVCFANWEPRHRRSAVRQFFLARLQELDRYHFAKHVGHRRQEQWDLLGVRADRQRPWWIDAHRSIAVPIRNFRRGLLARLGIRDDSGLAQTEANPEAVHRKAA